MSQVKGTMITLEAVHSSNNTVVMTRKGRTATLRQRVAGIPSGVFVDLGAGVTTVDVALTDEIGSTIMVATTFTADSTRNFGELTGTAAVGTISSVTTAISGGTVTTVTLYVRQ